MADVNSHISASTGPISQTFGKNHHRYVHGLRTSEVITMRKMLAEMNSSLKDLIKRS
jgi:hypothetical protein